MRYRTERKEVYVPYTQNGKTHPVPRKETIAVPVIPRDWDVIVTRFVTVVSSLDIAGALVWSTVSIGSMLSSVAPEWAAYLIAGVFDLAWIVCMALEWLSRFRPKKARLPKFAGWVALLISMSAIAMHGQMMGQPWVGLFGAAVSLIAKSLWTLVMRHHAVTLNHDQEYWFEAEMGEIGARQAQAAAERNRLRDLQHLSLMQNALLTTPVEVPATADETPVEVPATAVAPQVEALSTKPLTEGMQLLTTSEFAAQCGVQNVTVRGWVHQKKLTPVHHGDRGQMFFDSADVDARRKKP